MVTEVAYYPCTRLSPFTKANQLLVSLSLRASLFRLVSLEFACNHLSLNFIYIWKYRRMQPWFRSTQPQLWHAALERGVADNTQQKMDASLAYLVGLTISSGQNPLWFLVPPHHGPEQEWWQGAVLLLCQDRATNGSCPPMALGWPLLKGPYVSKTRTKAMQSSSAFWRKIYFFNLISAKFVSDHS